jgi:hypothetical protein
VALLFVIGLRPYRCKPAPPLRLHVRARGEPHAGQAAHSHGAVRQRAPRLAHAQSRAPLPLQACTALRLHVIACVTLAPQALQARATLRLHAHAAPCAARSRRRR